MMRSKKLLVVSDTHHRIINVQNWALENPHDILIHLGDHVRDGQALADALHIPTVLVRGNNDECEHETPWEIILPIYSHRLLLVHGHLQYVEGGLEDLTDKAVQSGCDIALFGHTHHRADKLHQGVRLLNPGSPMAPRDLILSVLSLEFFDNGAYEVQFVSL